MGGLGKIGRWLEDRRETIRSVEDRLLDFFHHSPAAFRESLALQMAGQAAALLEVYLNGRFREPESSVSTTSPGSGSRDGTYRTSAPFNAGWAGGSHSSRKLPSTAAR
jgi:hypothetical protein